MKTMPLVSVIVTTRNNHATLQACLASITAQSYERIELIVVDNNSTDGTKAIAKHHTKHVYNQGPERSAQRNFGVVKSTGAYILIIDSDMELTPHVVEDCITRMLAQPKVEAVIVPEESFGEGFWARCKSLERSFYVGIDAIEAARFFDKKIYQQVGGYNEQLTGGEDWDLTNRIRAIGQVGRAAALIRHNEGRLYFMRTVRKMYYYAKHASVYFAANPNISALTDQSGPLARYKLFFSQPRKLFNKPLTSLGMLTLKTAEYVGAGMGMFVSRQQKEAISYDRSTR